MGVILAIYRLVNFVTSLKFDRFPIKRLDALHLDIWPSGVLPWITVDILLLIFVIFKYLIHSLNHYWWHILLFIEYWLPCWLDIHHEFASWGLWAAVWGSKSFVVWRRLRRHNILRLIDYYSWTGLVVGTVWEIGEELVRLLGILEMVLLILERRGLF